MVIVFSAGYVLADEGSQATWHALPHWPSTKHTSSKSKFSRERGVEDSEVRRGIAGGAARLVSAVLQLL